MHNSAIAGACAGLVSSIVTCPLDVVKTKLQAQGGPDFQPGTALSQGFKGSAGGISGGVGGGLNQLLYPASSGAVVGASGGASATGAHASHAGMGIEWSTSNKEQRSISTEEQRRLERRRYGRGLRATVRQIWEQDGVRGFYRGLGPTVYGYLPTWAIYFTVYDSAKRNLVHDSRSGAEVNFVSHIVAAMTAGVASTICTSPLWVVKTRFMLQSVRDPSTRPYRHTFDAFVQIYRTEGMRGFYKGLIPSLFGVSHVAVQFPLYETFKKWAREANRGGVGADLDPSSILVCSAASKMIASITTYPHEVLRTRLQMQPRLIQEEQRSATNASTPSSSYGSSSRGLHTFVRRRPAWGSVVAGSSSRASWWINAWRSAHYGRAAKSAGIVEVCTRIAQEEGIRGFYKGMGVNLMRTLPSSALTILTYEIIMQQLHKLEEG
ncbi:mitochondrial carrier [Tilletiaria anomala UBC 951]|uniref:Mitochondrial carrier n=1 Tax=Tilletiaria anomala (strain ATCC 24038 / CBS 436.72 / UBC 951) TaxID=1037660 RepID=A0A066WDP0_TILAU|nr:mitochondrial carrier [Tilletiaria anomala UBC 951]KDN52072.1 mitochondrial carrier [Tilletiaria anomala UBC 951]